MARRIGIGNQDFETVRKSGCFYIDKTGFIRDWWESRDSVTLITRPRRFGKTLNMSMLEKFFSVKYQGRGDLFQGLNIWEGKSPDGDYKYRKLQGTYPVISLSFADIKETTFLEAGMILLERGGPSIRSTCFALCWSFSWLSHSSLCLWIFPKALVNLNILNPRNC